MSSSIPYVTSPVNVKTYIIPDSVVDACYSRYAVDIDYLAQKRKCIHCLRPYTLAAQLGRHPCVGHTGHPSGATGQWECCNQNFADIESGSIDGCCRVDHIDSAATHAVAHSYTDIRTAILPLPVFLIFLARSKRDVLGVQKIEQSVDALTARSKFHRLRSAAGGTDGNLTFLPPAFVNDQHLLLNDTNTGRSTIAERWTHATFNVDGVQLDDYRVVIARTATQRL